MFIFYDDVQLQLVLFFHKKRGCDMLYQDPADKYHLQNINMLECLVWSRTCMTCLDDLVMFSVLFFLPCLMAMYL